jgi:cysteine-rich repeat protein
MPIVLPSSHTRVRGVPIAFALIAATASLAHAAVLVPGGGSSRSDCYAEWNVDAPAAAATSTRSVQCEDGDPACDFDGECGNNGCRFRVGVCLNVNDPAATACIPPGPALPLRRAVERGPRRARVGLDFPAQLNDSACGAFVDVDVPVKRNARKPGKILRMRAVSPRKPRKDNDVLRMFCVRRVGDCPPPTTTTTTTTLPGVVCGDGVQEGLEECDDADTDNTDGCLDTCQRAACGDGFVQAGVEQCDPPCGTGCGAGEICNSACACVAASTCACGAPDPTTLTFTTTTPLVGNCGLVRDSASAPVEELACGGLYFGGGAVGVPLPATVPDLGQSVTKTCCSGTSLSLAATTEADTGSRNTCTGKDCFFGAPLPIPNYATTALSTCVVNVVARNAVGSLQCDTGASELNLPLSSQVFLTADLLNGTTADRPDVPGTQPCPICARACAGGTTPGQPCADDAACAGGTCGAAAQCLGGARHGMACTPGTSALPGSGPGGAEDTPYPTSHDCPLAGTPIGTLPIGFALTTETASRTAVASGSQPRVFCGFCRDTNGTFFFEGDPLGLGGALHPCTSNADCAEPWESCEQNNTGAFAQGAAASIVENGARATDLTDHASAHASTLVSVFCIPPTFNPAIDASADLPGPGAVSLPGTMRLQP